MTLPATAMPVPDHRLRDAPELLDVPRVMYELSLSERMVRQLIASGELPSTKVGARRLVFKAGVIAYLDRLEIERTGELDA